MWFFFLNEVREGREGGFSSVFRELQKVCFYYYYQLLLILLLDFTWFKYRFAARDLFFLLKLLCCFVSETRNVDERWIGTMNVREKQQERERWRNSTMYLDTCRLWVIRYIAIFSTHDIVIVDVSKQAAFLAGDENKVCLFLNVAETQLC